MTNAKDSVFGMKNSIRKKWQFRFGLRHFMLWFFVFCLILGFRNQIQICYHRLSLSWASSNERYEHDIQRLVDLGHFAESIIELDNIEVDSQQARDIFTAATDHLRETKVPFLLSMGPYGSDAWPDSFEVKCHPDFVEKIEGMVANGDRH